ncbi:MAG TPA: hypothetical protein PK711_04750 [Bacteroidales bacterium]|nr:hypothetical protein [Bacteroidales bacterium]HRZ21924.1 hypothetical protein [Bacteroidales bacterium]
MPTSLPLLNRLRQFIWTAQFRRELSLIKRRRKYISLMEAENIGILYDASEEKNYILVYTFVRTLMEQQKKVKALGFVNSNIIPHYCHPRLSFDYFTLKDLNWYKKPVGHFVKDFISNEFDMIINLDVNNLNQLTYITGVSIAHFKVGRYLDRNKDCFDLMIDLKEPSSIEILLKEINHYLTILRPPDTGPVRIKVPDVQEDSLLF